MSDSGTTASGKRRWTWKRIVKWGAVVLGFVVVLGFLTYGLLLLQASRKVRQEIEAIQAANEPLNYEEMLRTGRDGHVTATVVCSPDSELSQLYQKALALCKGWSDAPGETVARQVQPANKLSAASLNEFETSLRGYRVALQLLKDASIRPGMASLPDFKPPVDQNYMDQLMLRREAARLLRAQALYAAAQGRGDEAADWCVVMCRFAHAFPGDDLNSGIVGVAVTAITCRAIERVTEMAQISPAKLRALAEGLADLDDVDCVRTMCGERVFGSGEFVSRVATVMPAFFARPNYSAYLIAMRMAVAAGRQPFPKARTAIAEMEQDRAKIIRRNVMAKVFVPALARSIEEWPKVQARVRTLETAIAVRRARAEGQPLPASLDVLVPKYLKTIPLDPFTGEPLEYRLDDTGAIIYSVGLDGVDDGGKAGEPGVTEGTDIVIRVAR